MPNREIETPEATPRDARPTNLDKLTKRNVASVVRLERAEASGRTLTDRIADRITAFCGSMHFVWTHVLWFAAWIGWNVLRRPAFDAFPFPLLTLAVSLEAIFLSTFILVSENRQAWVAERRNHLDLQINMLAEQENTKMLMLLAQIARKVGVELDDAEVRALATPVDTDRLVAQIDETAGATRQETSGKKGGTCN